VIDELTIAAGGSYDLGTLYKAQEDAADAIAVLRGAYAELDYGDDIGLAVIGSIGRYERTQGSDLDILILSERDSKDPKLVEVDTAVAELAQQRDFELSNPTGHPKFGVYKPSELAREIGEDADSNTRMTVRMCLLLESVDVGGRATVSKTKESLMETYLAKNNLRDGVPPRFLLNEVVRFWRTMAVDFEGKMRRRDDRGWALRNGKLRTVRKMLYASGLLPLLQCEQLTADAMRPFLSERFELRPADRVAAAFLEYGLIDDGARALQAYSDFLRILDSQDDRRELDAMNRDSRRESELWERVQVSGRHLHDSITALLFDSQLGPTTREYAVL
jgi:predicted nucleotidyltransferase